MTTRAGSKRAYSLAIIEARDVRKATPTSALYVSVALSGNKLSKTQIKQSLRPVWQHTCALTAELTSVLSLRLKLSRRWPGTVVLGSVDIRTGELLDRCKNNQRTTLTLRDEQGQEAGSLVVQLLDITARAPQIAIDGASHDIELGLLTSSAIPELVQNTIDSAPELRDLGGDVVNSLKKVVEKTKTVADFVNKTAKLHPYAHIAWQVMSSAYQAVQRQIERDNALRGLLMSMLDLYSFVDAVDELENKIKSLEDVIIRISVQTTECGIFIKQYASQRFLGRVVRQTISNTSQTILDLSQALGKLKEGFHLGLTSHTAFISAQTSGAVKKLVEIEALKRLDPAKMNAGNRETCLPGTRVVILNDLFDSLTDPGPPSGRNIIWLRGLAGSGKSTILNTVARHFSELGRTGAFLFWDRNDAVNSDPLRVIPTLAFQLADFSAIFAAKLAARIERSPQITTSSIDMQFRQLLQEPLEELAEDFDPGPIVIVLDALDECGTAETRKGLLRVLSEGLAKFPSMFQLLIASRDEPDIRAALLHLGVDVRDTPMGDDSTSSDIELLFQRQLSSDNGAFLDSGLPPDWPGAPVIQQLVSLSGGLFIWASTTIRFIESGLPEERLKKVLSASAHSPSYTRLDDLYWVALTHPFDSYDATELKVVHSILGAIVVARERLTDEQLSRLLGLAIGNVRRVLSLLQPLLQGGRDRPVQVLHTSFTDFLSDFQRCRDPQWYINTSTHHLNIASGCLRVLQRDLKFNICGIKTSDFTNKEIEGVQEHVDKTITPVLMYASQYWVDHLECGPVSEPGSHPLADRIRDFLNCQFLYWIEVFSVTDRVFTLWLILRKATAWARNYERGLEEIISEAYNFVNAFQYPISQSVPHIYLSALPFSPFRSVMLQGMRNMFQNTLSVEGGHFDRWPEFHQTLAGHSGPVWSVAFSPDSTRIISGSEDCTIQIWDALSGAPIGAPLQGHSHAVWSVAFSPDGTRIISASEDGTIQIWDAVSGAPIGKPLRAHRRGVWSVAYSFDGTRIVSGSADWTIQIWDAMSGAPIGKPLQGHSGPISQVAFSPDGTRIVSGSKDFTIQIWDAVLGTPIGRPLQGHFLPVRSVAFSPDGTRIISSSCDCTIRIWDAVSGAPIGEPLKGHGPTIWSVAFSPDGTRIISGSDDKTIRIWDTMSGMPIGEPLQGPSAFFSITLSPDGTRIVSGCLDNMVRIWDASTNAQTSRPPSHGHASAVWSVAFSPDGTRIVSGSEDRAVRIWDATSGAPITGPLQGHSHPIRSVAFSPDGTRVISASDDETVRIWNAVSGAPIGKPLQAHCQAVWSVAYSFDGTRIVSGSADGTVRIWDAVSGAPIGKPLQAHCEGVWSVAYSFDGTRIVSGSADRAVRVWDAMVAFPPDIGAGDHTVRIWDAMSGALIGRLQGHVSWVRSVAFSPDGTRIISGSDDGDIWVWDAVSGATIGKRLGRHLGPVWSVVFSPSGTRIVSASSDKTIQIWDAVSGEPIGEPLQGPSACALSVAFSPDGTRIVSGYSDNVVRIWDATPNASISKPPLAHTDWVRSVAPSPGGTHSVSAPADKIIQVSTGSDVAVNHIFHPQQSHFTPSNATTPEHTHIPNGLAMLPNGSLLHVDGWVSTTRGLLFWVPPEYRLGLFWPRTLAVTGTQPTPLNMERFVHGQQWTQCHTEHD